MKLKTEEKFAFLQLAQYIAQSDGEYGLKEKEIIGEYCIEMGIDNFEINKELIKFDEILNIFKSETSQRIVMLSLMALIHIDDHFGLHEHKTMTQVAEKFNLSAKTMHAFSIWGKSASALYEQGLLLIEG
ncbi:MAG: TerB family tellurite resistance protein [Sulfurospirillaceae bacterium]|nr:TerB family tellurite resistance protein [Sulfurospirillaceae bacterium]